jgi:hypothetical protein
MKKQTSLMKNNKGTTMILVVLCAAYITLLCSILLTVSLSNREMKTVERKSTESFYTAETALEEIKTGLGNLVAAALEDAYLEVMEEYVGRSDLEKRRLFASTFINDLEASLSTTPGSNRYRLDLLGALITEPSAVFMTLPGENLLIKDLSDPEEPKYLMIQNVKISFTDSEQYRTDITTDIVINTPGSIISSAQETSSAFSDYSLIADHGIMLQTAVGVETEGSIYSGEGGISLDNSSTLLIGNAENVVTRGDISVRERSSLRINGNPMVWAQNIMTRKGSDTTEETSINIDGRCYVADDLTLNASSSRVTLTGEYYGYSYGTNITPVPEHPLSAGNSSAVMVNGRNSVLELSTLTTLLVAGRAYIDPSLDSSTTADIYTGESVSVKQNEYAYLVPAEFLWCGVNPVPYEVYQAYHSAAQPDPEVDYNKVLSSPFPVRITDYADGFLNLFYEFTGGQKYVYYYMKFNSEALADEYMQKYYEIYETGSGGSGIIDFNSQMDRCVGDIRVNSTLGSIISSGNLFTYNETDLSSLIPNTVNLETDSEGNKSGSLLALEQVAKQLVCRYDSMKTSLEPIPGGVVYDSASLFHTIINSENLLADINGVTTVIMGESVVYIVNNEVETPAEFEFVLPTDESLPHNGRQGIVIATGTVRVAGNYNGLILAGGDILMDGGANVKSSQAIVRAILSAGNPAVNRYFRAYASGNPAGGTGNSVENIKISDLIEFSNWKKNEE